MISLMVAHDPNRVIGINNELPWHIPEDLAYFKKHTVGKSIIMGRNTFESIGRPLPKRKNIVVTRNEHYHADGIEIVHNLDEAMERGKGMNDEIMVIGGEQIFRSILPKADRLYITLVQKEFEGDTFFPEYGNEWELVSRSDHLSSAGIPFSYLVYERKG
ncbi:dihydrofolate reductase [Planococcus ruber]|uniref:dihydrofolate reductase n=1 Tax=Planococcus ruber TaxID=2027871 RepID=UPI001FEE37F1|nr:dihydrofolate reductase [Planococcus ruber]MCJ1907440.1 dihydrofolate reductase [Planococcus ruber]